MNLIRSFFSQIIIIHSGISNDTVIKAGNFPQAADRYPFGFLKVNGIDYPLKAGW
jgi:hypothetical protein